MSNNWKQLHTDAHISGGDGFSFILVEAPLRGWHMNPTGRYELTSEEKAFVEQCLPGNKPRIICGVEVETEPFDALRMYLCASMSATFALSTVQHSHRPHYMIGSRSQKDLFKITLKFPETTNIKAWDSNTTFYIRVAEDDAFSEDGSATIGSRRKYSNEGW